MLMGVVVLLVLVLLLLLVLVLLLAARRPSASSTFEHSRVKTFRMHRAHANASNTDEDATRTS